MAKAAYVHIPFCAHKCDFCDFAAFANLDHLAGEYCDIVSHEIESRLNSKQQHSLSSVFFGGGTPGYIDSGLLVKIIEIMASHLSFDRDIEITLETTPHSITKEKAKSWLDSGINRLSIGIESFHDHELKAMGRDHTREQALKGIALAIESGFENISLDFMYGLPDQTLDSWESSLKTALDFELPHMSAYGLTIAQNSPLLIRYPRESSHYPPEETFVHMYEKLLEMTSNAGLSRYEISNFSKTGFKSRHNIIYWSNEDYFGFGVSAHRYVDGVRSSNFRSLNKYMKDYLSDETREEIDAATKIKEAILLGLRLKEGIDLTEFNHRYNHDLLKQKASQIDKLLNGQLIEMENNRLWLSTKGVLVSNLVISELI